MFYVVNAAADLFEGDEEEDKTLVCASLALEKMEQKRASPYQSQR